MMRNNLLIRRLLYIDRKPERIYIKFLSFKRLKKTKNKSP